MDYTDFANEAQGLCRSLSPAQLKEMFDNYRVLLSPGVQDTIMLREIKNEIDRRKEVLFN